MTVTMAFMLLEWEFHAYGRFITWLTGEEPGTEAYGEAWMLLSPIAYVYGTVAAAAIGMTPYWGIHRAGVGATRIGLRVLEDVGTPMFLRANPTTWSLRATAASGAMPESLYYGHAGKTAGTMAEIRAADAIAAAAKKPAGQKGAFRALIGLVGKRAAGRGLMWAGSRAIPVVGWGLLAMDVYYLGNYLEDRRRERMLDEWREADPAF